MGRSLFSAKPFSVTSPSSRDCPLISFYRSAENPVSTTELTVYQTLVPEFDNRGVKLIVLAPDTTKVNSEWVKEIQGITPKEIIIPFIADPDKEIAHKFDM